jgi:GAF domain-containing protein
VTADREQQYVDDLTSVRDIADLADAVRTTARRWLQADGATFVLRDGEQCYYADEDAIAPLWKGERFPIADCISGWAMTHGDQAVVPDIHRDARVPLDAYLPTFVRGLVMTPIGDPPVAAVGVYWATHRQPTPDELGVVRRLASYTADALTRLAPEGADWPRLLDPRH